MPSSLLVDYYDKYGSEWGAVLIGFHMCGTEHSGIMYRDTIMQPNWLPITQDEYPGSRLKTILTLFRLNGMMLDHIFFCNNGSVHPGSMLVHSVGILAMRKVYTEFAEHVRGSRYDHETIWSRVITFTYLQVGGSLLIVVSWLKNIVGYHLF